MKAFAIIVAGGAGTRMQTAVPKQFLEIGGKALFVYTIEAFVKALPGISIVLVVPAGSEEHTAHMLGSGHDVSIVPGDNTRFDSVKAGLWAISFSDEAVVMVHDAVRCLVTPDLIQRCYSQAVAVGSAVPTVPSSDSIRIMTESGHRVADRSGIRIVQTPQTFLLSQLRKAYVQEYQPAFTDDATVMENAGYAVELIEGEPGNIKVTHPADLAVVESKFNLPS